MGWFTWRLTFGAALVAVACGETGGASSKTVDSGSIVVAINSMNASDIRTAGTIQKDENISTGTGNPWGEFVKKAKAQCGKDPAGFEVVSAVIALDTSGSGGRTVTKFEETISGAATIFFASTQGNDASATKVDVADANRPTGAGPVALTIRAAKDALKPLQARLLGGDFHVGLRAATSKTSKDDFSMNVRATVAARASCE
jgi:hypothetical protein